MSPLRTAIAILASAAWCAVRSSADGLAFPNPSADLGLVKAAGTIQHQFEFTCSSPLEIVELRPSCGCLRTALPKRTYLAGDRGAIPLHIHATSQPEGRKRFELRVTYRDPVERTVVLTVDARFQSDVKVEPSNLIVQLQPGEKRRQIVTITDRRPRPLAIREVVSSTSAIRPTLEAEKPGSHVRQVELLLDGDKVLGRSEERIEIRAAAVEVAGFTEPVTLEVPITLVRPSSFALIPDRLVVHRSDLAEGEVVKVANLLDKTGSSEAPTVRCSDPNISVECRRSGPTTHRLRLTVRQGAKPTTVELIVGGSAGATIRLPVEIDSR